MTDGGRRGDSKYRSAARRSGLDVRPLPGPRRAINSRMAPRRAGVNSSMKATCVRPASDGPRRPDPRSTDCSA
jgi:hypothetical protein